MPTASVPSDWTSRSVPEAWGPERLAAYVDGALSGADAMLFTATPREELDGIGRFQQLKDQAWVGQVRAIVAAWNRASDAQREFAADEVALAIGVALSTASKVVGIALSAAALPGLLEAVLAGMPHRAACHERVAGAGCAVPAARAAPGHRAGRPRPVHR